MYYKSKGVSVVMEDLIPSEIIESKIYNIRGLQVMLDEDIAVLYGVETKHINQAVRNNLNKFPIDFYFELCESEIEHLKSKFLTSSWGGRRKPPKVFTEQGIYMLATIIKSKSATSVTVAIMRTFVQMRKFISQNASFFKRLDNLEIKQIQYKLEADDKFNKIFKAIESKDIKPKQGIFYEGQIFDAYLFVSDIIKLAKESIVLIDNYVDESILVLFTKRNANVNMKIYTNTSSKQLQLDLEKHNAQYPKIEIEKFDLSHDRFLIIDKKEIYHFGASLKDLGKKWFAVSKMDIDSWNIMKRLERNNEAK